MKIALLTFAILLVLISCNPNHQNDASQTLTLADGLTRQGNWNAAEQLLIPLSKSKDKDISGRALLAMGRLAFLKEDYDKSEKYFKQLAYMESATGEADYELGNLNYVKWAYGQVATLDTAKTLVKRAANTAKQQGDERLLNRCYYRLGSIAQIEGSADSAKSYFKKALELAVHSNDTAGMARSYTHLSELHKDAKQFDLSIKYDSAAIAVSRKTKDYFPLAFYLGNLAQTYLDLGRKEESKELITEAVFICEMLCNKLVSGRTFLIAGNIHNKSGSRKRATYFAEKAKAIASTKYEFYAAEADQLIQSILKNP